MTFRAGTPSGWWLLLLALATAVVVWVRLLPLERSETTLQYRGEDGRNHVYLGDFDSYLWLRMARNQLRNGTVCDAIVAGQCWDSHGHAPLGVPMLYSASLHVSAIASLHRLITWFEPGYPLPASAFLLAVIVAALGVWPAFAIGWRLAGPAGAVAAALLSSLHPVFLQRSIGGDNDVWNIVLPLFLMWAGIEALLATSARRAAMLASAAGAFAVLHAPIWSGWQLTFAVMIAGALAAALHRGLVALRMRRAPWRDPSTGRALLVAAVFVGSTLVGTTIQAGGGSLEGAPDTIAPRLLTTLGVVAPQADHTTSRAVTWPNVYSTVGELARPNVSGVRTSVGDLLLGAGWLGALLLMFPSRAWCWWHALLLLFCIGLSSYAFLQGGLERATVLWILALAAGIGWVSSVFDQDEDSHRADIGLLLIVWDLAVLLLAHDALRFTMVLVAPLALGAAMIVGRSCIKLDQWLAALPVGPRRLRRAVLIAAVAIACLVPVRQGAAFARSYTPAIDSAWWDTLTAIRNSTPPDTIVNAFWNYGYWSAYVAERRVTADGASLNTHLPYWLARVLYAADEREAFGVLRMLNCASDALPREEGAAGAYAKLVTRGIDEAYVRTLISELVKRDRDAAQALLKTRAFTDDAIADVLASTHCTPPPAVLVLTSKLGLMPAWSYMASWNFAEAEIRGPLHSLPREQQIEALTRRFELSADEAQTLLRRTALSGKQVNLPQALDTEGWTPCAPQDDGRSFRCPIDQRLQRFGLLLTGISVRTDDPAASRLRVQNRKAGPGHDLEVRPALVLIAGAAGIEATPLTQPRFADLAILFDAVEQRVLIGSPTILQSTFTQLMYLDGRYSPHFRKLQDHVGFDDNRVVAWSIDWAK